MTSRNNVYDYLIYLIHFLNTDSDQYISGKPEPKAYVATVRMENTSCLNLQVGMFKESR